MKTLLAVSGGVDSMVMLDMCMRGHIPCEVVGVVHVDHGIHEKSAACAHFVERACHTYGVPYFYYALENGAKSEDEARKARYACFVDCLTKTGVSVVVLAHHRDDTVETVLLGMLRGSSVAGLPRLTEKTPLFCDTRHTIYRPLLHLSRQDIDTYAVQHNIQYTEDPTNKNTAYARNRLRLHILPEMEHINTRAREHIIELAEESSELDTYLHGIAQDYLLTEARKTGETGCIRLATFGAHPTVIMRAIIRGLYIDLVGSTTGLSRQHIETVVALAKNPAGNKHANLPPVRYSTGKRGSDRVLLVRKISA